MKGIGRTVFQGSRIEEFQVEILGVLENIGPRQSLILGRLSGGPLEHTGVMQGMSGSPVYIDGKLVGAVAMAFPFSKDPIAGIRPIEEMLAASPRPARQPVRASASPWQQALTDGFPKPQETGAGAAKLINIATPLSFSGFTQKTVDQFTPQLRALGMEPVQGLSGGGAASQNGTPAARLEPGSMISVELVSGDMIVGADGTITHIDGQNVYAFGHRFLAGGPTEMPFARAEVLTLLPNVNTSFKISAAKELAGTMTEDRNTAVTGVLGRKAATVPLSIEVNSHGSGASPEQFHYKMEMVKDRLLTPFLLQMAVFSALDATERMLGPASVILKGSFEMEGGGAPIHVDNMYAGDFNVPLLTSASVSAPLAYALQNNFESLQVKRMDLTIDSYDIKRQVQIDRLWTSKREAHPGDTIDINATFVGANGIEISRKLSYTIPVGESAGPMFFTASDGNTLNFEEYRALLTFPPHSAAQLVRFLNALRGNTKAFVKVWTAEPDFSIQGENLPDPPPSLAMILAKSQPAGTLPSRNSKLGEYSWDMGDQVVSGSKTVQVDIKE